MGIFMLYKMYSADRLKRGIKPKLTAWPVVSAGCDLRDVGDSGYAGTV